MTKSRESRVAEQKQRDVARLREIEQASDSVPGIGKKGYCFVRESDRITAALEIGRLVEHAKKQNVTVAQIKEELPRTNRLDRYMLRPTATAPVSKKATEKLQQKVFGYLDAAQAVANLTGQDPDELKVRVLCATSLWAAPSLANTSEDPRASHLALELNEMCRAVVKRCGVLDLFDRARRILGAWDVTGGAYRAAETACLIQSSYLDWFEHWTEAPPLPYVPLVRIPHAMFRTPAKLEAATRSEIITDETRLDSDFEGTDVELTIVLWREVGLAIGPMKSAESIGLMFESRAHVALSIGDGSAAIEDTIPDCTLKPRDDPTYRVPEATYQIRLDGRWRRITTLSKLDDSDIRILTCQNRPYRLEAKPGRSSFERLRALVFQLGTGRTRNHPLLARSSCRQPCDPDTSAISR